MISTRGRVRRALALGTIAAGSLGWGASAAGAQTAPLGANTFNVFAQAVVPAAQLPAVFPEHLVDKARRADLPGGPVYVAPAGRYVSLVVPDENGAGSFAASLAEARKGRLVGASVWSDGRAVVTQLVPDGIRHVRIGTRRVRVIANVARATVTRDVAFAYLRTAHTGRGLAAFGLR